jgi:hypothetical protein|tara:strand:+ start:353 stop:577 length:225 start_codon:yes stop_codon:yes gene_type:complete
MELASKKKPEIITMDGTDYPLADFTDKGRYLLNQCRDLEDQLNICRMKQDQVDVALQSFTRLLADELEDPAEVE